MASVAFQDAAHRTQGPYLLDLDAGTEPPRWVQVIGGILLILAFVTLACFWLKPLSQPGDSMLTHLSPNVLTVPAIRTLEPAQRIAPDSTTIGPTAENVMQMQSVTSDDALAFRLDGDI